MALFSVKWLGKKAGIFLVHIHLASPNITPLASQNLLLEFESPVNKNFNAFINTIRTDAK